MDNKPHRDTRDKFMAQGTLTSPMCHRCINWQGGLKCVAFPQGIPLGILTGELDHTKPIEGDNGVRFKAK